MLLYEKNLNKCRSTKLTHKGNILSRVTDIKLFFYKIQIGDNYYFGGVQIYI